MLLEEVLATERLAVLDPNRPVDKQALLAPFAQLQSSTESEVWDAVTEQVRALCGAESAGISIFADRRYDELTWVSVVGELAPYATRRFPRRHSLCGVSLERRSAQLFVKPHLYFQWIAQAGVTISEGLVAPLFSGDDIYGTIWAMFHTPHRHFSGTDALILTTLGEAATTLNAAHGREPRAVQFGTG